MWLKAFVSTFFFFMCSEPNHYVHEKEKTALFGMEKMTNLKELSCFHFQVRLRFDIKYSNPYSIIEIQMMLNVDNERIFFIHSSSLHVFRLTYEF